MRDEMNHLIEYYTVLRRAGEMIFGDNEITSQQPDKKLNFGTQKADDPEENLLGNKQRDKKQSDSENSDDYLFGNKEDGKCKMKKP